MHNRTILLFLFLFSYTISQAQNGVLPNFWTASSDAQFRSSIYQREIVPEKYLTYALDSKAFESHLDQVLPKSYADQQDLTASILLPNPSGKMETYIVRRDNLLPKKLNEKYPEISVFAGYCAEDPHKTVRFDFTAKGFRAVSYGIEGSTYYLDPIARGVKNTVISYYKKNYIGHQQFECMVEDAIKEDKHHHDEGLQRIVGDCELHIFELALACTGEYATFHGGTKASVMAEYTTAINRINGLFETELGIRHVFVPNTDELIFLDAATDPYNNNDGGAMLNQNQNTIDGIIGANNYDIGHVFSTGGGGIAQLNSPCGGGRARGVTGLPNPSGDPFFVDFVAHELGHQYGATHSYNNSCGGQRSAVTAYEPGSGATIMGYAGICPPNVQFNSDAYFHSSNLVQIANFLNFANCDEDILDGSDRPNIDPLQNYNIPIGTPFELTANATVNDGSVLTYCWEQYDREIAEMPPQAESGAGPLFRSLNPVASGSRIFPSYPFLLSNTDNEWEVLPEATREINFRVSVRASGGGQAGCIEEADLVLNSFNTAGPFLVLVPNSNEEWTVGENQLIVWDVANTDDAPINCQNVNITMSTDGGFTYPITLLENTPNDGQADIVVPNFPGNQVRIRVQAVDNVFFNISNQNLEIVEPVIPTFTFSAIPTSQTVCGSNAGIVSYELNSTSLAGFNSAIEYTATGLPNGTAVTFENNNSIPNATTTLNIGGLENVSTGSYTFTVEGNGGGQNDEIELTIDVIDSTPFASNLLLPEDTEADVSTSVILNWTTAPFADQYFVEVSTDPNFNNIVFTDLVTENNTVPQGLTTATVYFWRVRSSNICGDGPDSEVYRFRTGSIACNTFSNNTSVNIPTTAGTITSNINVPDGSFVETVILSTEILHSWIGDLTCNLISPDGTSVAIFDRPGFPAINFGCPNNNIRASFDDMANNDADAFEGTCGDGVFAIDGTYQSIDPLGNLQGDNSAGDWVLEITDNVDEDGGSLETWSIEICTNAGMSLPPVAVSNNPLSVVRSNSAVITSNELSFSGETNNDFLNYMLFTLPSHGMLMKNNAVMQVGDFFTQTEINNNEIVYNHNGSTEMSDSFIFDVVETNGGWAPNNTFQIEVIELNFLASASQTSAVSCFEGEDGSISISAEGGTPPYAYSLDGQNFQASNLFNDLSAGEYTFTVQDSDNNIITTNTIVLDEPEALTIEADVNENTVSLTASGGTGNVEYSLDNNIYQASNVFNNLANGEYVFYVRDANDCISTTEIIIILINDLSATASITASINCHDAMEGEITINVSGGTAPFSYTLNGGNPSSSNIFSNLVAGDYTVVVEDANQLTVTTNQVTLSSPEPLTLEASSFRTIVTLTATGGIGDYEYSLNEQSNYQTSPTFDLPVNGDYTFYVRDNNGCITSLLFTMSYEETTISANIVSPILCNGDMTGIIEVTASGGIAPYQYSINGGPFQDNNQFQNLAAGDYTFRVMDSFSDVVATTISLVGPSALTLLIDSNQGSAELIANGGTAPYTYRVDNGNSQNNPVFGNLAEGQHQATVIDSNNCETTVTFTISINNLVATVSQLDEILCNGDQTASISVSVVDGLEPYTYSLDGTNFQAENTFTNLGAGQYTVSIIDAENFSTSASIIIEEPDALIINEEVNQNNATLNAQGGTAPYEYSISGEAFQTSNEFTNLDPGTTDFQVRDANGCTENISIDITFEELTGTATIVSSISCSGENDGSIEVIANGGTTPYSYSLNNGAFQQNALFTDLGAGVYTITVRDNDGTEIETDEVVINELQPINLEITQDGQNIMISATGGTGDFVYSIDGENFQDENTFEGLVNGNYTAYVLDANDCEASESFTVSIDDLIAIASVSQGISCFNESDGIIVVETSGGISPIEYSIDGTQFQDGNFFEGLGAGEYTVTVRDAIGQSTITDIVVLNNPEAILANLAISQNDLTIIAIGGTGDFTYSIDGSNFQDSNEFTGLTNGDYTAYIVDENGCEYTEDFSIDFTSLSGSVNIDGENLCALDMDVSIVVLAENGLPPYRYAINGMDFQEGNIFENLGSGSYDIVIEDASGTIFNLNNITVDAPPFLSLTNQVDDNSVTLIPEGGTSPYRYSIDGNDFQDGNAFNNLENGDYTGFVQDANGCITESNFSINVIGPLSITVEVNEILDCTGLTAGNIFVFGDGGTPPYLFSIDNGPFTSETVFENLPPAEYSITIQDANLNEVSTLALLTAPNPLELEVDITDNDIEIMVSGGAAPYNYSIDGGQAFSTSPFFADLDVGTYEVVVVDGNECSISQMIEITSTSIANVNHDLIIDLSPNPADQFTTLIIESDLVDELSIELLNILGQSVRNYSSTDQIAFGRYELNLNGIIPGTYLVKIEMNEQVAVRKLVVQ